METMTIIWIIIIFGFLLIEVATPGLVAICFSIAGVVSLVMQLLDFGLLPQLVGYAIALGISLYFLLPILRRLAKIKSDDTDPIALTNLDLIIGTIGIALSDIDFINEGLVKVDGKEWTAKVEEDIIIKKDTRVLVKEISGSKIIVEPVEREEK
ncbi:MAG: NfeD family protein [Erysipelotrichales bacterium]